VDDNRGYCTIIRQLMTVIKEINRYRGGWFRLYLQAGNEDHTTVR